MEKEEKRKGRENSPYPARVGRVTDNQLTDRDSDESEKEASVKELERDYLEAKEKAKATKEKYEKQIRRARRVRTGNAGEIFTDKISEAQYTQMEREFARGPSRRLRRVKKSSPSSRGAASTITGQSPRLGGRTHDSSVKEKEDKVETEDMVGTGDFRGVYPKDMDSKLRRIINRIKSKTVSDPVMKGKIINATGGRWARFCAGTGCSVNIMPAKMAASGGLKWRDLDLDEPSYKSVTNEDLDIVGQTSAYIKLEKFKTPVRMDFLVCLDEGDEALLSLDTLKELK